MPNTSTEKACPGLNQYQQLASGALSDIDKEALLVHLETCDACALKLKALPEQDTLVGLLRQAETVSEESANGAIAQLVERLTKLRPEQSVAGAQTEAPAAVPIRSDITIDQQPIDPAKKATYDFL